MKTVIENIKIK